MKVWNAILGVLSILAAMYCVCYPGMTFLNVGWIVAALLGGWGICTIVDYFAGRKDRKEAKDSGMKVASGVVGLIIGILALIVSMMGLFNVISRVRMDVAIVILFGVGLIFNGCTTIATALTVGRKLKTKTWPWTLVLGILVLICGIYSLCHLLVTALTIGWMFGIYLMIYGVRLLASCFAKEEG